VHRFAANLAVAPREGAGKYIDDRHYLRFAFATPADADIFQRRFGRRRLIVQKISGRWRDEYLAVPVDTDVYFRTLTARIPSAIIVPCRASADAIRSECHANARKYVAAFGGRVVPGWLVNAATESVPGFAAHSVVEKGSGMIDVTLSEAERGWLTFLPHEVTAGVHPRHATEQFEWLVRNVGADWRFPAAIAALSEARN
jgi:hypothetical protein